MNILGIHDGHTSGAALMIDGEIIACVSEERFNRLKSYDGFPKKSIKYLSNLCNNRIDLVAFGTTDLVPHESFVGREYLFSVEDYFDQQCEHFYPIFYKNKNPITLKKLFFEKMKKKYKDKILNNYYLNKKFKVSYDPKIDIPNFRTLRIKSLQKLIPISKEKIFFIDHHKCHANHAYYSSPLRKNTVIVTADGVGDRGVNATVSITNNQGFKKIFETTNQNIGRLWRYITLLMCMKPQQHEYKVMGLAPYADKNIEKKVYLKLKNFQKIVGIDFKYVKKPKDLFFYFRTKFQNYRFDGIAGGIQKYTEEIFSNWIQNILKKTKHRNLVFSGGISMNIKLNLVIHKLKKIKNFYVSASGADESIAIGACYELSKIKKPLSNIYLGPKLNTKHIDSYLNKTFNKKDFKIIKPKKINKYLAKEISRGKIIARCFDRMEFGARALGNRSILADPSNLNSVKRINTLVKQRDFWMPFTPSIIFEKHKKYIKNPKNLFSPHMTIEFESTKLGKKHLKAAMHPYDETVRPQMLKRKDNPMYYDLLKQFEKISGISALLNTSYNLHGYPIVCNVKDAVSTFKKTKIDILQLNNFIIIRKNSE